MNQKHATKEEEMKTSELEFLGKGSWSFIYIYIYIYNYLLYIIYPELYLTHPYTYTHIYKYVHKSRHFILYFILFLAVHSRAELLILLHLRYLLIIYAANLWLVRYYNPIRKFCMAFK